MMLIPCELINPQSNEVAPAIFDADSGIAYIAITNPAAGTVIVTGAGAVLQSPLKLKDWEGLLFEAMGES